MAATGKTPILLYGSTTPTNAPVAGNLTNSSNGCEIAINVADKNLFFKDSSNNVNTVPIRQSSASSNGWLSSTDWSTFNGKQPAGSYALTTGTLAQFASTTSAQLAGVISDETGTGNLVFANAPTFLNYTTIYTSGASGNAYNHYYNDSKSYYVGLRGDTSNVWAIADESAFRLAVFPSGGVSIGNTTDPGAGNLSVNGNVLVGETTSGLLAANRGVIEANGSSTSVLGLAIGGTTKGYIFHNGTDTFIVNSGTGYISVASGANGVYLAQNGTAWVAISDETRKDIIEPISNAVDKVSKLRAVIGKYKTDKDGVKRSFLIAQDVKSVFPEAVIESEDKDGAYLGLAYTDVIPLLVAAINELTQKVETLEKTNGSN